mmetsp:Transcript_9289/g.26086  ORF Transcript_9289/g.26086 Transcript_9289/m.26086 type:complete len:375 (+) Transcript_9289:116-1240(+)
MAQPAPAPGPDAAGGGAPAPPPPCETGGREGFRFRVSGLGALQEADITRHFSKYGEVLGVDFAHDPRTGAPAGKASVRLCGFESGARAAVFNDSHLVNGYTLTVTDDCERKLFIGGFKDTPAEVVRDHLALFGELEEFDAAVRDQNGKPRGYAFARFKRQEDLERVLAQAEHTLNGRKCNVRKAEARPVLLPKSDGDGSGGKKRPAQRSASRSGSPDGRRRARGGSRGKAGKGGLQVAPGYEYKDGVGAQPIMAYPSERAYPWGPPPPHPYYGYPPPGMPPPGYGAPQPGPPMGYGTPPPSYGYPSGYGSTPGYGAPPRQGWPPPPTAGYSAPPGGPPHGYDAAPQQAPGAYGPSGYGPPPQPGGYARWPTGAG